MQHLDEGIIHAWIDGELPPDEVARVEAHAKSCAACGAMVAEARGLVAASSRIVSALDATPSGVLPAFGARRASRWTSTRLAVAATLVIAAGTLLYRRQTETPSSLREEKATIAVAPIAKQPTTAPLSPPPNALPPSPVAPQVADRSATQIPITDRDHRAIRAPGGSAASMSSPTAAAIDQAAPKTAIAMDADRRAPMAANASPAGVVAIRADSAGLPVVRADSLRRVAAQPQSDSTSPVRSPTIGRVAVGIMGGSGAAGGAVRKAAAARPLAAATAFAGEPSTSFYVGCYELNESTDVLPKRFALRADSATAGLYDVRYVDSTGVVDGRIQDVGWTDTGRYAGIRTAGRGEILTIVRSGNAAVAQSPLGPRTVRVTTCR